MTVLVVDNYDSFAYNLVQYVGEVVIERGGDPDDVVVRRNDAISVADVHRLDPDGIVVSPGPGTPHEAGISTSLFAETAYPTLGVCLGHQALCAANGASVGHAPSVVHGKPSLVRHDGAGVYRGLPNPFRAGRYHSLAVDRDDLPADLVETARTEDERSVLMGVRHAEKPHVGVQFHPESILTGRPVKRGNGADVAPAPENGTVAAPAPENGTDVAPAPGDVTDAAPVPEEEMASSLEIGKRLVGNFLERCSTT